MCDFKTKYLRFLKQISGH